MGLFSDQAEQSLSERQHHRSDEKPNDTEGLNASEQRKENIQWVKARLPADYIWPDNVICHSNHSRPPREQNHPFHRMSIEHENDRRRKPYCAGTDDGHEREDDSRHPPEHRRWQAQTPESDSQEQTLSDCDR